MSFELGGRVIADNEIGDIYEFNVMLALADATNKETMASYPSLDRISEVARISKRKVVYVLTSIEKKGWIQILRRTDDKGRSLANVYRITKYKGVHSVHPGRVHSVHGEGAQRARGGCTAGQKEGAQRAPKPVREPVREPESHVDLFSEPTIPTKEEFATVGFRSGISQEDCSDLYDEWKAADWCFTDGRRMEKWKGRLLALKNRNQLPSQTRKQITPKNKNGSCL